jgi:hypothetical protein
MFSTHDQKPNVSPSFGTSKGVAGSTLDIVSARVTRCVAGGHPVAMMHQLFKKKNVSHLSSMDWFLGNFTGKPHM